jgi:hypothetical protein
MKTKDTTNKNARILRKTLQAEDREQLRIIRQLRQTYASGDLYDRIARAI